MGAGGQGKALTLPSRLLLKKTSEFQNVYRHGKRLRGRNFILIFLPNGRGECRVGVSVHGVKKAVRRNRIKRLFKEFFRLNRDIMDPAADIVFAVRGGCELNSLETVEEAVRGLLAGRGQTEQPARSGREESGAV